MVNSPAPALTLFEDEEPLLREWLRSSTIKAGLARRARIVLLAADGVANAQIAKLTGSSVVTVLKWRARYEEAGVGGLPGGQRCGRAERPADLAVVTPVRGLAPT